MTSLRTAFSPSPDDDAHGSRGLSCSSRWSGSGGDGCARHGEVGGASLIGGCTSTEHVRAAVHEAVHGGASPEDVKAQLEPEIRGRYQTWENEIWIGFAIDNFLGERD